MLNNELGYIVRVANVHGDFWLGQRIYLDYDGALVVKHNLQDTGRYTRVYIVPATQAQHDSALDCVSFVHPRSKGATS